MQVAKWGNSLAVRLPASVIKVLDLQEGDDIEINHTTDNAIMFPFHQKPGLVNPFQPLHITFPACVIFGSRNPGVMEANAVPHRSQESFFIRRLRVLNTSPESL